MIYKIDFPRKTMVRTIVRTFVENSVKAQHIKSAEKFVKDERKTKLFLPRITCNSVKYKQNQNLLKILKKQCVRKLLESG